MNVAGGQLSLGDGHCRQGEGEVCGTAVEAAMRTVVVVDLIKGGAPAWPRLESDDFLMSTGCLENKYTHSCIECKTTLNKSK